MFTRSQLLASFIGKGKAKYVSSFPVLILKSVQKVEPLNHTVQMVQSKDALKKDWEPLVYVTMKLTFGNLSV